MRADIRPSTTGDEPMTKPVHLALIVEINTPHSHCALPLDGLRCNPFVIGSDAKSANLVIPGFNRTVILEEYYELDGPDELVRQQRLRWDNEEVEVPSTPVVLRSIDGEVRVVFRCET
jgi:hypothetical protein